MQIVSVMKEKTRIAKMLLRNGSCRNCKHKAFIKGQYACATKPMGFLKGSPGICANWQNDIR